MSKVRYRKFQPLENARLALNYLTGMVDPKRDFLPYWLVAAHENPAFAKHCRVDDAELVASWYEAIVAVRDMLGTDEGADVQQGFYNHMMKSWGPQGLRYHEDYPWSATNHSSFHEMAYILGALNRMLEVNPDDTEAEKHAAGLVRGMRGLVIERKMNTFWSGDYMLPEPVYEFPNDVYLRDRGWDLTCQTGRGEQSIRNGMMLHSVVVRWDISGDEVAKDLAIGMANYLLGTSRYFNWNMEFFGHVHSAVWVASGLARLGRLLKNPKYVEKAKGIYDHVRSISSSFGWVPEYAQWSPLSKQHCETCCIKDMIQCATELIDCGYEDYWQDVNSFARNQLVANQIITGSFVAVDNSIEDTDEATWRDIDKRIVGGFSGGSLPNMISLKRFRSIAGCCVGTAPQALQIVWDRATDYARRKLTVNIPVDKSTRHGDVEIGYPNDGYVRVTPKREMTVAIRLYDWMGGSLEARVGGRKRKVQREGNLAVFEDVPAGATVELTHPLRTRTKTETARGRSYKVRWRGPDVVDMSPRGTELRLWQREEGKRPVYPRPTKRKTQGKGFYAAPTQQKR